MSGCEPRTLAANAVLCRCIYYIEGGGEELANPWFVPVAFPVVRPVSPGRPFWVLTEGNELCLCKNMI